MNAPQDNIAAVEHRLAWLTRLLGAGVLALVAVTWKLWTPQEVFPRVPLFRWAPPDWWDWASLALIVAGGVGLLIRPQRHVRPLAATLAFGLVIAFVCDQHRLQPWAWQFFILALLIALADEALLWNGWQWLTISIYFYSAISKFDADFLQTTANSFIQSVNQDFENSRLPFYLAPQYHFLYPKLAWVFPIGELLCAILLTVPRSRTYGWAGAVVMHLCLIRILGPTGLQHSWGVLVWNLFFIPQAIILFGWNDFRSMIRRFFPSGTASSTTSTLEREFSRRPAIVNKIARLVLGSVLLAPALSGWKCFDLWPGWAVYVKPYEEAYVIADADAFVGLTPAELQRMAFPRFMHSPETHRQARFYIPFQQWSLNALKVPAYPDIRNSLAVALDLAERYEGTRIEVRILQRTRWQARGRLISNMMAATEGQLLASPEEVHHYCKRFWFNSYPTSMYRRAAREKVMNDDG